MAAASISAYQWLYWLYLSLSVAALVSQSQYQSTVAGSSISRPSVAAPPFTLGGTVGCFTLGGTVGCCPIRGRGYIMGPLVAAPISSDSFIHSAPPLSSLPLPPQGSHSAPCHHLRCYILCLCQHFPHQPCRLIAFL